MTVWMIALLGIVGSVFSNTLPASFVWDDEQFIFKNIFVLQDHFSWELLTRNVVAGAGLVSNLYRPLQSLTHWLDVRWWGLDPMGHHATNILIQLAASGALFIFLKRHFSVWAAFIAALFFAVHPIQTEAVAYISGRGDLLGIAFLAAGLALFEKHLAAALVCALLAVFSKESQVLFPVFLWLDQYARKKPIAWKRHAPFWALSGGYVLLRATALNFKNTFNFYSQPNVLTLEPLSRVWTYCTTAPKGFLLWLFPADLHHERAWPVFASPAEPQVWLGAMWILAVFAAAFYWRKRDRRVTAGILWFFAATFPTSNLVVLINAIFYDHWFILPGIGLTLILGVLVEQTEKHFSSGRWTTRAFWGIVVMTLASMTMGYNLVWRTPVSLYTYILTRAPQSAKMNSNLGMAYADEGNIPASIEYYTRSIAISDEYPQTHHNLARSYQALGRLDQAVAEYQKALAIDPLFFHSWIALGTIAWNRRDWEGAETAFTRALEAYPYLPEIRRALDRLRVLKSSR